MTVVLAVVAFLVGLILGGWAVMRHYERSLAEIDDAGAMDRFVHHYRETRAERGR